MSDLDEEELKATKEIGKEKCRCCEELEEIEKLYKAHILTIDIVAKLIVYKYVTKDGIKYPIGPVTCGEYKLRYCPECGRKLVKHE